MGVQKLKACPCGKIPKNLYIGSDLPAEYAYAVGNCCDSWYVRVHTDWRARRDKKLIALVEKAWNDASRGE